QPFEAGILNPPSACASCHGNYDPNVEPYDNWRGSMMAHASYDPIFLDNMAIANQDAPDSGDLCLRCHLSRGWLQGRSVPTDGSRMLKTDEFGVACDFCHRLVDPIYDPCSNPPEDAAILAGLSNPASNFANGMATIDPTGARRGPFLNADTGHPVLVSPFHREAALCGTCHDVSNPAFEKDPNGEYFPNTFDAPATNFASNNLLPVERTYSEWFYSAYNSLPGVYAPQFGGNKDYVSTCQDCHMRDVTGEGCNFGTPPTRTDLPLHDMTGGSTWLPSLLSTLHPNDVNETTLQAGIARATYMLQNAADLALLQENTQLKVTVTNNTGHKLPTGYPEGRRIWINVQFYDEVNALISESAAYDPCTGYLSHDAEAKIYEIEPGIDPNLASILGMTPGPSFHFVLNNKVYLDNRIPPRGFTNSAYDFFGGSPVAYTYHDGQYWDDTYYDVPSGATSADVTLYYQSTSKEFVEFLRDENTTTNDGNDMYDLWNDNGKSPPEIMQTATIALVPPGPPADMDGNGEVDFIDYGIWAQYYGNDCTIDECGQANLDDGDDIINDGDLRIFCQSWLFGK
ncbi:MAG: multiheme c-type cytochrome, partial [Planctomycetota bacterium]